MPLMSVDLETSSESPLQTVGASAYLHHTSTIALMAAFHPVSEPGTPYLWRWGDPIPYGLVDYIQGGGIFTGWNVIGFDRIGWRLLMERLGWPPIPDANWRDSMQLAAAANLPRGLDACAKAIGLPFVENLKDKARIGRVTDQKRTPIPAPVATILDYPAQFDAKLVEDMRWLADRCVQDVVLEENVLVRLPPWPDMDPWLAMPFIDRQINDRGILIDVPLVQGLHAAAVKETMRLDAQMAKITNGQVSKTSSIEQLKRWLLGRGVDVPRKVDQRVNRFDDDAEMLNELLGEDENNEPGANSVEEKESPYRLRKNDIANLLATPLPDDVREVLYMRAEAAKASTKKLKKMLGAADSDGFIRRVILLMGAQATGRFSSTTVQVHNLVRDAFGKDYENIAKANGLHPKNDKAEVKRLAIKALATAIEVGRTGDADLMRVMYEGIRTDLQGRKRVEGVLPWISRMMRRTIAAPEGHLLLNGDFANIQARLPVWLAGQTETVEKFRRGEDLYREQASPVYNIPPDQLTSEQRQIGKVMRLFLGFAAGVNAFIPAAMVYGISIPKEEGQLYVNIFRETNQPLVELWDANLQAAMWAVQYPGHEFRVPPLGLVSWFTYGDCLCMRLPSGRLLRYWEPRIRPGHWPDGSQKNTPDLSVLVVKGKFRYRRNLWRGLAMQNLICAIEADLLCNALNNMEKRKIPIVLHVHDSTAGIVREDDAEKILPIFKECMLDVPRYYDGLPIAADVDASARFG